MQKFRFDCDIFYFICHIQKLTKQLLAQSSKSFGYLHGISNDWNCQSDFLNYGGVKASKL